jgi:ketosteroid isomerase-like protein
MSTDRNIAAVRRLIDIGFTRGDLSVVAETVSPDCIEHQRGSKSGVAGAEDTIRTLHRWFSDFSLTIEDLVAVGDMVWARNRARGVNTGRPIEIDVIDVVRMADGKIVEHWGVPDQLGMLMQLDLLPRREPAPAGHPTGAYSQRARELVRGDV